MRAKEILKAFGFMSLGAVAYAQTPHPPSAVERGVTRTVLFDEKAFRVTRTLREGGTVEAPGTHAMDVLIIPVSEGTADVTVAGKSQGLWKVGGAFFIPRNVDHRFANTGTKPLEYIAVSIH